MTSPLAVDSLAVDITIDTVKTVGVIIIGVMVLLAVAFAVLVKAVLTKILSVVIVLAIAVAVFLQRDNLSQCPQTCECRFFGIGLKIPDNDLAAQCKGAVSLGPIDRITVRVG